MSAPDISREACEARAAYLERDPRFTNAAATLRALRAALDAADQRTQAASAAAWLAAREVCVADAILCAKCASGTEMRMAYVVAQSLRALPPPSDAMAALAEVVRVAVEREREAICALIQEVEFPDGSEYEHDVCSDYADRITAAIRARSEGEGA
jgi:hypothetical protein